MNHIKPFTTIPQGLNYEHWERVKIARMKRDAIQFGERFFNNRQLKMENLNKRITTKMDWR